MASRRPKKYKLGLALGGGGARGYAHLGAVQALYEKGIFPDCISGVSAGAIVGSYIAAKHAPEDAFEKMKSYKFFDLASLSIPRQGLFSLKNVQNTIERGIGIKRLEDLPTPLVIAASDMLDGKVKYFKKGDLSKLVQASSSIPVLFSPVKIGNKLYSDGGVFDNLPIKPLSKTCEKIIAINISPVSKVKELKNIAHVATRMFQLSISSRDAGKRTKCDVFIEPKELSAFEVFDTKYSEKIYKIGYEYVKEMEITL
ncbi:MAG: patatin-like phospholipase family protein [Bacteroidota bacterium]